MAIEGKVVLVGRAGMAICAASIASRDRFELLGRCSTTGFRARGTVLITDGELAGR